MPDLPPEIAFQRAIDETIERYGKLKKLTASIVVRRDDAQDRLDRVRLRQEEVARKLDAALDADRDDEALALMQEQEDLQGDLDAKLQELQQAQADADEAKASVVEIRNHIQNLKAERDRSLAKLQSVSIVELLDGASMDAELVALENVRSHIKTTLAEVELNRELADSDLDVRLQKLREARLEPSPEEQLAALKRARANAPETGDSAPGKKRM